ncbi:MAG TPA: hypothetical protein PLH94_02295 [Fimbriimonadaceae bacterium]|nr:hypothetical protein [Fimbriimonadaceae bacterium]
MKIRTLFFVAVVAVVAIAAAQDTVKLARNYVVGQADSYKWSMTMKGAMGEITIDASLKQAVKKVYDNGDADIETTLSAMEIDTMGQKITPPASPPTTQRMTRFGQPVGLKASGPAGFMNFATMLAEGEMKVGQEVAVDRTDPDKPKHKVKGTFKLESVVSGEAKIVGDLQVWSEQTGDKPMKMKVTSWVAVSNGSAIKVEGVITDLPAQQGMAMDQVTFSMTRTK